MAPARSAAPPRGGFAPTERFLECVHCGLCQNACPTYLALGAEADSPRGRIHLMRALQEGRLALDAGAVRHLDLCLGCRGCETACPSGVAYGELIEAARPWIEARYRRPLPERWRRRIVVRALTRPRLLRALVTPLRVLDRLGVLRLVRAFAPRVSPGLHLLPASIPPRAVMPPAPAVAAGDARGTPVHLVPGCVMPELCGDTVRSTARVLAANGWRVTVPAGVGCCGALALHAGDRAAALTAARRTLDALAAATPTDDGPPIVATAAGCGAMMKGWDDLFADDPARAAAAASVARRVRDATELLTERPLRDPTSRPSRRVAYHDPCHLAHAQGVRAAPRALLAAIPGLTLVPMDDEDLCCGSAGHYNVIQPAMARTLVARKVAAIRASGVDLVATANAGCALQLAAGLRAAGLAIPVRHVVDLLAEAYDRR
ncbi:MAG: 4Fe-4S dicluster domain-containing protein [Deltaproteobacteria bacterium]|nr:4Fe-4S dicluster domain-containing protein [Deltaproteobacteria bacterium]